MPRLLLAVSLSLIGLVPLLRSAETIKVRTLALGTGEMPEVYLPAAEGLVLLDWSTKQPSGMIMVPTADSLPLLTLESGAEGGRALTPLATVPVPRRARGVLLLGWPTDQGARYVAIEDNFADAAFDQWLLVNTASVSVAFQVGKNEKPAIVMPGTTKLCRIEVPAGKGAAVTARVPIDGESRMFFSTYWPVRPDRRSLVIFIEDGNCIRVRKISDRLTAKPSARVGVESKVGVQSQQANIPEPRP